MALIVGHPFSAAAQDIAQQPDAFEPVDANGVNLLNGVMNGPGHTVAIGPQDHGGLSVTVRMQGRSWRHDLSGVINKEPLVGEGSNYPWWHITVPQGPTSAFQQTLDAGFYLTEGSGTFTQVGQERIYIAVDGTRSIFRQNLRSGSPFKAMQGQIERLERRNGEVWLFHYTADGPSGPEFTNKRLQSVTNNFGYQIHFEYLSNTAGTEWGELARITAFSNAVDWCEPTAFSCTYSRAWPSVSFTKTSAERTITDGLGNTSRYFFSGGRLSGYSNAAAGVGQAVSISYASYPHANKVGAIHDGAGTWTYGWSNPPPNDPPYYELATTVTDPLNKESVLRIWSIFDGPPASRRIHAPRSFRDPLQNLTQYGYESGRLVRITYPEGNETFYWYDDVGTLLGATHRAKPGSDLPDQNIQGCTIIALCGRPPTVVDARGAVTDYTYDPVHGGVITETRPAPEPGAARPQIRYAYQPHTAWRRIDASGVAVQAPPIWLATSSSSCMAASSCAGASTEVVSATAYQPGGSWQGSNLLPISVSQGAGDGSLAAVTTTTWTATGDPLTVDGPLPGSADTVWQAYDVMRKPVGIIGPDPDGGGPLSYPTTRMTYDASNQVIRVEQGAAAGQSEAALNAMAVLQRTDTGYDALGRKIQVNGFVGAGQVSASQFAYDAASRLVCSAVRMNPATFSSLPASACEHAAAGDFGQDRIAHTVYDAADRPTVAYNGWGTALQQATQTQAWTANGQVDWVEDANGNRSDYAYDGFDRLSVLSFPYPTPGSHAANPADYEAYGYDANDNAVSKRVRSGEVFTTAYDALNRPTFVDAPTGTKDVAFTYDLLGRQLTAAEPGVRTVTSTWDALGRQTSESGPLGTLTYQYDLAGRRTRMTWPEGAWVDYGWNLSGAMTQAAVNGWLVAGAFAYDDLGRRTLITRGNGVTTTYAYDAAGRLGLLSHDLAGTGYDVSYGFAYNPAGQVVQRKLSNSHYAYTPGTGAVSYTSNGLNQTTSAEGLAVAWDARGNLTSDGVRSYGYDAANRLIAGGGSGLAYDPLDRLYYLNGTGGGLFQYDGSQLAAVHDTSGARQDLYVGGPDPDEWLWMTTPTAWSWPLQDAQGSVAAWTDVNGNAITINAYDEYGQPGLYNLGRMGYNGQMVLPDAGVQSYKARAYHPRLGRFMQTDPVGYADQMNLYAYVQNDPVNRADPSGMVACPAKGCGGSAGGDSNNPTVMAGEEFIMEPLRAAGRIAADWNAGRRPSLADVITVAGSVVLPGRARAASGVAGDVTERAARLAQNVRQGRAAEAITEAILGSQIAGRQVTFVTSAGTRSRADFITVDRGIVETKSGGSQLSPNQRQLHEDITAGREVIPVGQNAIAAGLESGRPTIITYCRVDRSC